MNCGVLSINNSADWIALIDWMDKSSDQSMNQSINRLLLIQLKNYDPKGVEDPHQLRGRRRDLSINVQI